MPKAAESDQPTIRVRTAMYLTDGAMDFSGGVDAGKVALLQSPENPHGLRRNQLAWLNNGTVRGGGITQRAGWKYLTTIADGTRLFQGGYLYEPGTENPYFMFSIGGHIIRCAAEASAAPENLSTLFGLFNPPDIPKAYFAQGYEFLVIQAGDYGINNPPERPLFWYGNNLRRSNGIVGAPHTSEIPAATAMDFYGQRLWYAQGFLTSAGDIAGGAAGTAPYGKRDSILKVTENPLAIAGDGFNIPTQSGPIRALSHAAAIDTALGEGQLFIFTRKDIYSLSLPVTRTAWIAAGTNNQPLQRVIQRRYGAGADRSIVAVNGDLYYQTFEPGIRSLALAVRFDNSWGNTPISRNVNAILSQNDRSILTYGTGMLFDNRLWQSCLPYQTPVGVAHKAVTVLDFDLISSFQDKIEGQPIPSWEGAWEGMHIMQLFSGDFGGLERAFAVVYSDEHDAIELWEMTQADRFDNGDSDSRVNWFFSTPSYPFGNVFEFKELQGGQLWVDRIYGPVDFTVEYRSDDDPCWHFWAEFRECTARNSCEDDPDPVCYPLTTYREANRKPLSLPHPPLLECAGNGRGPAFKGYSFQVRITIKGFCRVRGLIMQASKTAQPIYGALVCGASAAFTHRNGGPTPTPTPPVSFGRITEEGEPRYTEEGDHRITED